MPNGVTSAKPQRLISEVIRLGPSAPVSFLPITAYDASHSTAPNTSALPSQARLDAAGASDTATGPASASNAMPAAAQTTAPHTRGATRSRRNAQLISATTAGIDAMITPADTALVMLTPNNMQIEKRKFPR